MEPGGAAVPHVADESIAGRRTWLRLHNRNHNLMNPRCQAFFDPRDNIKQIDKQRAGSGADGKSELWSLVGRPSHALTDESTAGRRAWLRLHSRNHNPMNPCCQAFFDPRDDKEV